MPCSRFRASSKWNGAKKCRERDKKTIGKNLRVASIPVRCLNRTFQLRNNESEEKFGMMNIADKVSGIPPVIGILALGLTPRPDLEEVMRQAVPKAKLLIRGGLDGAGQAELDALGRDPPSYPLMVRLADKISREVDMRELLPFLIRQGKALCAEGAQCIVLMCSGGFPEFHLPVPVIRPVSLLLAASEIIALRKQVGIINPIASQQIPAAAYWSRHGYTVRSAFASPFEPDAVHAAAAKLSAEDLDAIVLDCMSFSEERLELVRSLVSVPVLLPMRLIQSFFRVLY
jgi:protein AroM